MNNLKTNVDQMDVQAWRNDSEALEIESALKDCGQNAEKHISAENSTNNSDPDDLPAILMSKTAINPFPPRPI